MTTSSSNASTISEGPEFLRKPYRQFYKFARKMRDHLFPFYVHELVYALVLWIFLDIWGFGPMHSTVEMFERIAIRMVEYSWIVHVVCVCSVAIPMLFLAVGVFRCGITLMLYYHGWLYESIGKPPSWPTKLFMLTITILSKRANFYSFQDLMPWLMPPSVKDTVTKYLETVRPILNDEDYEKISAQAQEFLGTIASQIQRKLWLKWLVSKNYVSDWWKEVVYMRYRNSLIKTNVACADIIYRPTTSIQAARAAWVTLSRQHFCNDIYNNQSMRPVSLGGIPLCTVQYLDYHRSLRIPCETSDKMIFLPDARHIAVYNKGCWYKVNIFHGRRMINAAELERAMQAILDSECTPARGETYLSALTAGPRDLWSKIRSTKFSKGMNKESLTIIENALEIVFLDDEERGYDEDKPEKYAREYAASLTGDGYRLWCDKPSVYMFSKNGRFTSNAEHSVVDAMIYVHVREYIKYHEAFDKPYGPDGHCIGDVHHVPKVERLKWELDEETIDAINTSYSVSKALADDFENAAIVFNDYGKDFIKKARVSPDAYIQMALQMAYYKDQGKFELTYEPAVMRLFKEGRTETVRSCSSQSCAFVRSMLDEKSDVSTRFNLMKEACDRHQNYYRDAMAGKGIDRHLFAMYVVSKYYQMESPFLDNVFAMNYALSSSQTPQHQTVEFSPALNKEKDLFWPAGAFTCPEGSNYGVSYTISATGESLSFHITSWKSNKKTDPVRFMNNLQESLHEMHAMVNAAVASK